MTRFREGERLERSDDRLEETFRRRRMTKEEVEEFSRKIGEDFKKYLKSPEREKLLEEITGKTDEVRAIDRIKDSISTIDAIGKSISRKYPHLLDEKECEEFLSGCSTFIKKVESRVKPKSEPNVDESSDDISDSSDRSVVVCKCYPHIHGTIIDSYSELEELIENETPEFRMHEGYSDRMREAREHFQLLKELPTNITPKEVRELAKKMAIDEDDAVNWTISNNRPLIYEMIELELKWGFTDTALERVKNPFDDSDPDIDWPW